MTQTSKWKACSTRVALIAASAIVLASAGAQADDSVVFTTKGAVKGTVATTYRAFLGIPYAAPPTGNLRWKAPQAAASWTGTRSATTAGSVCPQQGFNPEGTVSTRGAEDCLYLNVYTPYPLSTAKLPVMIWIHGGAFVGGSGSDYDPSILAKKANAVVVTLNYRLGALGFLAHPALTAESGDSSGNFGLLDQQAAIGWVKTNVANFGGDVTKTTLFGESAGGASVWANVISPKVANLFQRAIVESGAGFGFTTLATAEANGKTFAANVGCTDTTSAAAACLRSVSLSAVLAGAGGSGSSLAALPWTPTVGGAVLPKKPKDAFAAGTYNKVPILQGSNHDEGRLFAAFNYDLAGNPLTAASYQSLVNQWFGSSASSVLSQYPAANYSSPSLAYATLFTDAVFACPARTINRAISSAVNVYAYEFNDTAAPAAFSDPYFPLGAYHGAEVQYIFQAADTSSFTSAQLALSNQMIKYWAAFAATGNSNATGLPAWTKYSVSADQVLSFAPSSTAPLGTFAADHKCAFWATLGY